MYMECRHIMPSGLRCKSPALRGGLFCYYHSHIHIHRANPDNNDASLELPTPEDAHAIRLSVGRINQAVISGLLDLEKAAALFQGLKIAAHFINPKEFFFEYDTVRSAEQSSDGGQLAPHNFVCKDNEHCDQCPYTELCPRCIHPDDDEEEDDSDDEQDDSDNQEEESDDEDQDDSDDEQDDSDNQEDGSGDEHNNDDNKK